MKGKLCGDGATRRGALSFKPRVKLSMRSPSRSLTISGDPPTRGRGMDWVRNRALQITAAAVAFYWLMVGLLGADLARDAVDVLVTVVCVAMVFRLLPHAIDRFRRGGQQKNWQVLMGVTLFFTALVSLAMWGFAARYYDRPDWMIKSPINGFLRFWLFGAGLVLFSATNDIPESRARPVLFYVVISLLAGVIIGAAAIKYATAIVAA
jgi:hypothetical protein